MIKIGIDVGGVIMSSQKGSEDTNFFGPNYLKTPENFGATSAIEELVGEYGAENVFIISKCGTNTQKKTLEWFEHNNFYFNTGLLPANVYFCKQRHEKAAICEKLGITDFIDDRLEVLSFMTTVPYLWLFNPDPKEVEKFKAFLGGCKVVNSWEEFMSAWKAQEGSPD